MPHERARPCRGQAGGRAHAAHGNGTGRHAVHPEWVRKPRRARRFAHVIDVSRAGVATEIDQVQNTFAVHRHLGLDAAARSSHQRDFWSISMCPPHARREGKRQCRSASQECGRMSAAVHHAIYSFQRFLSLDYFMPIVLAGPQCPTNNITRISGTKRDMLRPCRRSGSRLAR